MRDARNAVSRSLTTSGLLKKRLVNIHQEAKSHWRTGICIYLWTSTRTFCAPGCLHTWLAGGRCGKELRSQLCPAGDAVGEQRGPIALTLPARVCAGFVHLPCFSVQLDTASSLHEQQFGPSCSFLPGASDRIWGMCMVDAGQDCCAGITNARPCSTPRWETGSGLACSWCTACGGCQVLGGAGPSGAEVPGSLAES